VNRFIEPVHWSKLPERTDSQKWIRHPLHKCTEQTPHTH